MREFQLSETLYVVVGRVKCIAQFGNIAGIMLKRTDGKNPEFLELVRLLDEELWRRYPETQGEYEGLNVLPEDTYAVLAYEGSIPAGCGCFKKFSREGAAELKRVFVRPEFRGLGISKLIIEELEKWALEKQVKVFVLETGINQPEALSLYEKTGYVRIENYGPYAGKAESVCMRKALRGGTPLRDFVA